MDGATRREKRFTLRVAAPLSVIEDLEVAFEHGERLVLLGVLVRRRSATRRGRLDDKSGGPLLNSPLVMISICSPSTFRVLTGLITTPKLSIKNYKGPYNGK
jgi:hypothetical protein